MTHAGCQERETPLPTNVTRGYDDHRFGRYLGNVGIIARHHLTTNHVVSKLECRSVAPRPDAGLNTPVRQPPPDLVLIAGWQIRRRRLIIDRRWRIIDRRWRIIDRRWLIIDRRCVIPSAPTHSERSRRPEICECFQTLGARSDESFVCVCALGGVEIPGFWYTSSVALALVPDFKQRPTSSCAMSAPGPDRVETAAVV